MHSSPSASSSPFNLTLLCDSANVERQEYRDNYSLPKGLSGNLKGVKDTKQQERGEFQAHPALPDIHTPNSPKEGKERHSEAESGVGYGNREDSTEHNSTMLAARTYDPLDVLYSQDIFSSFMLSFATCIGERINDEVIIRHRDPADVPGETRYWQCFTLESPLINAVALAIEHTGLGSMQDIKLSIIPALMEGGKLPAPRTILSLAQKEARIHEHASQYVEAAAAYEWLFRTCCLLEPRSILKQEATAEIVEFLFSLQTHISYCLSMLIPKSQIALSQVLVSKLGSLLERKADARVLFGLASLLIKQKRTGNFLNGDAWDRLREASDFLDDDSLLKHVGFSSPHAHALSRKSYKVRGTLPVREGDLLGWTPLHYAALNGDEFIAELLLRHGADVNARDRRGWGPLHYAVQVLQRPHLVSLLIEKGAMVDMRGYDGTTALHCAAYSGNDEALQTLLDIERHGDIQLDDFGFGHKMPLHWAVLNGSTKAVALLLLKGADATKREIHGRTPLHLAVIKGHRDITSLLLKQKVSPDVSDDDGLTALHLAASLWDEHVVGQLLAHNANPHALDRLKQLPLHKAVGRKPLNKTTKRKSAGYGSLFNV